MKLRSNIQIFFLLLLIAISEYGSVEAINIDTQAIQSTRLSVSQQGIQFDMIIPWTDLNLEPVQQDNTEFIQVSLPSGSKTAAPGAPELPLLTETIAIPFGVTLEITVTPGKSHTQHLSSPILPVPYQIPEWPLPDSDEFQDGLSYISKVIEKDQGIYSRDEPYPGNFGEISNIGVIRQQRVVGIALYPVHYNPVTNNLAIYESLHVSIAFQGEVKSTRSAVEVESPFYESLLRHTLLNYQESHAWRMQISEQNTFSLENIGVDGTRTGDIPWSPPSPSWRIKVGEDGFYQLTYDDLSAAGLDVENLNPQTFQLFHMGTQVTIQVDGEADSVFNPEDTILFYGQSIDDKYTADNVYWLTYGSEMGPWLRMTPPRNVTPGSADLAESYPANLPREVNAIYWKKAPGTDELERFLWADFYASPKSSTAPWIYNFNLENTSDGSGYLDLAMVGFTDFPNVPDHHAVIEINGVEIDNVTWDGRTWQEIHADIPSGTLTNGVNSLSISLPRDLGVATDYVRIDKFEITYQSVFQVSGSKMVFSYDIIEPVLFHLTGFTTSDLNLYDISDPNDVVQLLGYTITPEEPPFTIDFQEEEGIVSVKKYFVGDSSAYKSVVGIEEDTLSDLQSSLNGADQIIITHAEFLFQAEALAAYRNSQDLRTILVDVQDIYDEFGFGIVGITPIRDFLLYAYEHWESPAPSFVVLVGDGHYNPKGYNPSIYGALRENYIPPYLTMADTAWGETATDNRYVAFVGEDTLPDMMLGRLAVNSPDGLSQQVLSCCLPSPYQAKRVYLGVTHADATSAKSAIIQEINSGVFLINYFGHGATQLWGGSGALLQTSDIQNLTNTNRYPIIATQIVTRSLRPWTAWMAISSIHILLITFLESHWQKQSQKQKIKVRLQAGHPPVSVSPVDMLRSTRHSSMPYSAIL